MSAIAIYFLLSRASAANLSAIHCLFPDGPYTSADLTVEGDEERGDSVSLDLKDEENVERQYKTITRHDAVARQLRRGRLQITLKGEKGRTVGSVTTDGALLVVDRQPDGKYLGRLAARGSVHEITCD